MFAIPPTPIRVISPIATAWDAEILDFRAFWTQMSRLEPVAKVTLARFSSQSERVTLLIHSGAIFALVMLNCESTAHAF